MTEAELERLAELMEDRASAINAAMRNRAPWPAEFGARPSDETMYGLDEAARIIREQPADPAWIAAATRLPAPHTVVYVFHNGHQSIGTYDHVNRTFRDDNDDLLPGATHWAALMDGPEGTAS